jgi:hypothetical protein
MSGYKTNYEMGSRKSKKIAVALFSYDIVYVFLTHNIIFILLYV